MLFYATLKEAIQNDTGLANTILHIHAGMLILCLARILLRHRLGSMLPFLSVVALELINEIIDYSNHGSWRWHDTSVDVISTLFWPLVISLAARIRPLPPSDRGA